ITDTNIRPEGRPPFAAHKNSSGILDSVRRLTGRNARGRRRKTPEKKVCAGWKEKWQSSLVALAESVQRPRVDWWPKAPAWSSPILTPSARRLLRQSLASTVWL